MPSFFRLAGAAVADVYRSVAAPAAQAGTVQVYARVVYGITQLFARVSDGTEYQLTPAGSGSLQKGSFGDGSDGNVTITGTVTLARDMYYDTLTVDPGAVLETASWRIYARTAIVNEGTIRNNGGAGGTPTAGARAPLGSVRPGGSGGAGSTTNGAAGGTGVAGGTSAACPVGFAGAGGAGGGASGGGGGTGGAGGAVAIISANLGDPRFSVGMAVAATFGASTIIPNGDMAMRGGGGGGGGDGAGGITGGGGGGGGGIVVLVARQIDNSSGAIQARGGNGGPGGAANCGGGGGGGGGIVYLVTDGYSGTLPDVSGGAAGAGAGTGTPAAAGGVGLVIGPVPG